MPAFTDRTGEKKVMKNGLEAEIIAYRGAFDCDVRFSDGYIVRNREYGNFKTGRIGHPNHPVYTKPEPEKYLGKENVNSCGLRMKITGYRHASDIDITFEDGATVYHKSVYNFLRGEIGHPSVEYQQLEKDRRAKEIIGLKNKNTNGYEMESVAYRGTGDIDVRFRNNCYVRHTRMNQFRSGHIKEPPQAKVGEKSVSHNGEGITLLEYVSNSKVIVRFDDGTVKQTSYCHFKSGDVANPNNPYKPKIRTNHLGEVGKANNGTTVKIVAYRSANDIDVQTEGGVLIQHLTYSRFQKGEIDTTDYASRIGEERISHCGLKAKVVNYENSSNTGTTILFEDGISVQISYRRFCTGEYAHPVLKTRKKCVYHGYECLYAFEDGEKVYYNTKNLLTGKEDILTPQQMYEAHTNKDS